MSSCQDSVDKLMDDANSATPFLSLVAAKAIQALIENITRQKETQDCSRIEQEPEIIINRDRTENHGEGMRYGNMTQFSHKSITLLLQDYYLLKYTE